MAGPVLLHALAAAARRQAEREWFGSLPHRLLIAGPKPEGLAASPHDRRPANPDRGRAVLNGAFLLADQAMHVGPQGDPWDRGAPNRRFAIALHRFGWLRDLLVHEEAGARHALRLVCDWHRVFGRWNQFSWSEEVIERRVYNLACAARRLTAAGSEAEGAIVLDTLARQARHLLRISENPARRLERGAVAALAGCALGGPAGEKLMERALARVARELPKAVLPDGGHASRSPQAGLELLFDLLSLDEALLQRGRVGPDELARAIDRLTAAARFFQLPDGRLAAFQGGEAVAAPYVVAALAHDDGEGQPPQHAPHAAYHRMEGREVLAIADAGAAAGGPWSLTACAQPLAIEVVCGRDRLITNSGWSPDAVGPHALRLTDAASTVALGDQSAGEPLSGFAAAELGPRLEGGARKVEARRHDAENGVWLELSHDGWAGAFGLIHDRRLFLDRAADDLRGEDSFRPLVAKDEDGPRRYAPFTVRFHLRPEVRASLARDKKSVLLRGPSDQGWWLRNDAVEVSIEPSVCFEDGHPRRASQIVLRGQVRLDKGGRVRWKLSRAEGAA